VSRHDDERGGWYARPEAPAPKRLGDVLPEVTRGLGLPDPSTLRELRAAWPEIVGGQIASHSRPRTLRDRVLTIAVDSAPWATQLRYLEAELLARLQARAGPGVVERIRLAVDTARGPRE
jgi:predicted nucleic acid-binding Zn ribbon protein